MSVTELLAHSPEWSRPQSAAQQDLASQQRLGAGIVCCLLDLASRIEVCENRSEERKLGVELDAVRAASIALSALMKSEGHQP